MLLHQEYDNSVQLFQVCTLESLTLRQNLSYAIIDVQLFFSQIETEQLLAQLVQVEMNRRAVSLVTI